MTTEIFHRLPKARIEEETINYNGWLGTKQPMRILRLCWSILTGERGRILGLRKNQRNFENLYAETETSNEYLKMNANLNELETYLFKISQALRRPEFLVDRDRLHEYDSVSGAIKGILQEYGENGPSWFNFPARFIKMIGEIWTGERKLIRTLRQFQKLHVRLQEQRSQYRQSKALDRKKLRFALNYSVLQLDVCLLKVARACYSIKDTDACNCDVEDLENEIGEFVVGRVDRLLKEEGQDNDSPVPSSYDADAIHIHQAPIPTYYNSNTSSGSLTPTSFRNAKSVIEKQSQSSSSGSEDGTDDAEATTPFLGMGGSSNSRGTTPPIPASHPAYSRARFFENPDGSRISSLPGGLLEMRRVL